MLVHKEYVGYALQSTLIHVCIYYGQKLLIEINEREFEKSVVKSTFLPPIGKSPRTVDTMAV